MKRPTQKELLNKIRKAREALREGRIALLNQTVMACDAIEMDYDIEQELMSLLPEYLNDITPAHYVGNNPPQRSYAPEISGLELFAFKIKKEPFNSPVYIKFTHADDTFWLVSLHRDRNKAEA